MADLLDRDNCKSQIFSPWLAPWPCDPLGDPYRLVFESAGGCSKWFKVYAHLENESDSDIPAKLKTEPDLFRLGSGTVYYSAAQYNYGSSSTNVNWADYTLPAECIGNCYRMDGSCQQAPSNQCSGTNCYRHYDCLPQCQVNNCDSDILPE